MNDRADHIKRRLDSLSSDAVKRILDQFWPLVRHFSVNGRYASYGMWAAIQKAISESYETELTEAARLVWNFADANAAGDVGELDHFARSVADQVVRARKQDVEGQRRAGRYKIEPGIAVETLEAELDRVRDSVVGDFRHGVIGGQKMAAPGSVHNTVNVFGSVNNSIFTVVQGSHVAEKHKEIGLRLIEILESDELRNLAQEDARSEINDLAEHVRDELGKPAPDEGKLRRGLRRMSMALEQFGLNAAAGAVGQLIAQYLAG